MHTDFFRSLFAKLPTTWRRGLYAHFTEVAVPNDDRLNYLLRLTT